MPMKISEKRTDPRQCICGGRSFLADKETEKIIVWMCTDCGRKQKFRKGKEIMLPCFLDESL